MQVFRVVAVCRWVNTSRSFEGTQRLHIQGQTFFDCLTANIKPPVLRKVEKYTPNAASLPRSLASWLRCADSHSLTHMLARTDPADPAPTIMKSYWSPLCSCEGELRSDVSCTLMHPLTKLINLYNVATL